MKKQRPRNLNLFTIRFPLPAIASILHRISGLILFLLTPFVLWGFYLSLASSQSFDDLHQTLANPYLKFLIWCGLSGLFYHLVAGIRHLLMDIGIGDGRHSGKVGAIITLIVSALLIISTGVWLW